MNALIIAVPITYCRVSLLSASKLKDTKRRYIYIYIYIYIKSKKYYLGILVYENVQFLK